MQQHVSRFFAEAEEIIDGLSEGMMDPIFDKGLAVAAGCILGHQRCRPPYIGWKDETIIALRNWLNEQHPEFIYPEET